MQIIIITEIHIYVYISCISLLINDYIYIEPPLSDVLYTTFKSIRRFFLLWVKTSKKACFILRFLTQPVVDQWINNVQQKCCRNVSQSLKTRRVKWMIQYFRVWSLWDYLVRRVSSLTQKQCFQLKKNWIQYHKQHQYGRTEGKTGKLLGTIDAEKSQ